MMHPNTHHDATVMWQQCLKMADEALTVLAEGTDPRIGVVHDKDTNEDTPSIGFEVALHPYSADVLFMALGAQGFQLPLVGPGGMIVGSRPYYIDGKPHKPDELSSFAGMSLYPTGAPYWVKPTIGGIGTSMDGSVVLSVQLTEQKAQYLRVLAEKQLAVE